MAVATEPEVNLKADAMRTSNEEKRVGLLKVYRAHCEEGFAGVPEISSEELLHLLTHSSEEVRSSVVLVDCRSEGEQAVSILPGAVTITEVEGNLEKYKDKLFIPYWLRRILKLNKLLLDNAALDIAIGRRSGFFTKRILTQYPGFKIRNHVGGILDWSHVGGPLIDRDKCTRTNRMHAGGLYHLKHLPSNGNFEAVLPQA